MLINILSELVFDNTPKIYESLFEYNYYFWLQTSSSATIIQRVKKVPMCLSVAIPAFAMKRF